MTTLADVLASLAARVDRFHADDRSAAYRALARLFDQDPTTHCPVHSPAACAALCGQAPGSSPQRSGGEFSESIARVHTAPASGSTTRVDHLTARFSRAWTRLVASGRLHLAASPPADRAVARSGRARSARPLRLGFVTDVIAYGSRAGRLRDLAQRRVAELHEAVVEQLGVADGGVDRQGTGDGEMVFLPAALDVSWAVPRLLQVWRDLLCEDNELYTDRLRLRMAVVLGPVAPGPLGFFGPTAVAAGRLLDSGVLRAAAVAHYRADLVVLISDALHSFVADPADPAFTRHRVEVKDYRSDAWLWIG